MSDEVSPIPGKCLGIDSKPLSFIPLYIWYELLTTILVSLESNLFPIADDS